MGRCIICNKWLDGAARMNCACGHEWCPTHMIGEVEVALYKLHNKKE